MILECDVGNSFLKWRVLDGTGASLECGVLDYSQGFDALSPKVSFSRARVVSVAGADIDGLLVGFLRNAFSVEAVIASSSEFCAGVTNGYDSADALGVDRWSAIVAAWNWRRGPVCVIDAGTALTIDLVAEQGQHLGGIIVPGLHLMRAALDRDTSDIGGFVRDHDGANNAAGWLGRDTRSAVDQGVVFMLRATIDKAVAEMAAAGVAADVLITGGDAEILAPLLAAATEHRPLLVLEGLRYLTAANSDA